MRRYVAQHLTISTLQAAYSSGHECILSLCQSMKVCNGQVVTNYR